MLDDIDEEISHIMDSKQRKVKEQEETRISIEKKLMTDEHSKIAE